MRVEVEPDIVSDVLDLSWIGNGEAELVYACHVLEHFSMSKGTTVQALVEWCRVLVPGGTLRLSVPDFGEITRLYHEEGVHLDRIHGLLYGGQNYDTNIHPTAWDYETLADYLRGSGFFDIRRWDPFDVHPHEFHDFSLARINKQLISLNVEATKES